MKRGFTIWEAIVALAMVIVVAVVVFPLFAPNPGRDGAIVTTCLSNVKQLDLGLLQYADEYDGLLPSATRDPKNTWRVAISPHVRADFPYKCPGDKRPIGPDGHSSSYALNIGSVQDTPGAKPRTLRSAPQPETLILLCEIQNTTDAEFDIDDSVRFPSDRHTLAVRHFGTALYAFADGHVKKIKPISFTSATGKPPVRWHRDPHHLLSKNALAVLADAQARAR